MVWDGKRKFQEALLASGLDYSIIVNGCLYETLFTPFFSFDPFQKKAGCPPLQCTVDMLRPTIHTWSVAHPDHARQGLHKVWLCCWPVTLHLALGQALTWLLYLACPRCTSKATVGMSSGRPLRKMWRAGCQRSCCVRLPVMHRSIWWAKS